MDNIRSYNEFAKETYIKERVEEIANAITKNDVEYKNGHIKKISCLR